MAGHYSQFVPTGHGLSNHQSQGFDPNFLDSMMQQQIEQQQHNLSPGTAESRSSAYSSSPARTPTMPAQQASPQPYASQPNPGSYFGSNPINIPRSSTSPVGPYAQPLAGAPDLMFGLNMGMDGVMQHGNGVFGRRTNSASASISSLEGTIRMEA